MSVHLAKRESEQLKRAIEAGDFERAPLLAEAYVVAIRKEIEAAPNVKERAAIAEQARSFLEDRLHLARVLRAHIGAQLGAARGVAFYQNTSSEQRSWQFEG
jgi:hypothetical protein